MFLVCLPGGGGGVVEKDGVPHGLWFQVPSLVSDFQVPSRGYPSLPVFGTRSFLGGGDRNWSCPKSLSQVLWGDQDRGYPLPH